jgi:hypothetical protein
LSGKLSHYFLPVFDEFVKSFILMLAREVFHRVGVKARIQRNSAPKKTGFLLVQE